MVGTRIIYCVSYRMFSALVLRYFILKKCQELLPRGFQLQFVVCLSLSRNNESSAQFVCYSQELSKHLGISLIVEGGFPFLPVYRKLNFVVFMCVYSLKAEFTWTVATNWVLNPHPVIGVTCHLTLRLSSSCNILISS